MIKIDTYNYEAFYLDYLEGNLHATEINLLFDFLKKHPECAAEVEGMEDILEFQVLDEKIVFDDKDSLKEPQLKSSIQINNVEDWMIGSTEGLLKESEVQHLEKFIAQHNLEHTFKLYQKIKFKPDPTIHFEDKESLLKKNKVVYTIFARIISIAAIFAIVCLTIYWKNQPGNFQQQYASRTLLEIEVPSQNMEQPDQTQFVNQVKQIKQSTSSSIQHKSKKIEGQKPIHKVVPLKVLPAIALNEQPKLEKIQINQLAVNIDELLSTADFILPDNNLSEHNNETHTNLKQGYIKVENKYQPVTMALSNITKKAITYQASTQNSDYKITRFKIGKFSFERKKKK